MGRSNIHQAKVINLDCQSIGYTLVDAAAWHSCRDFEPVTGWITPPRAAAMDEDRWDGCGHSLGKMERLVRPRIQNGQFRLPPPWNNQWKQFPVTRSEANYL